MTAPRLSAHQVKPRALAQMDAALRHEGIARVGLFLVAGPPADDARVRYAYAARDRGAGTQVTVASASVDVVSGEVSVVVAEC